MVGLIHSLVILLCSMLHRGYTREIPREHHRVVTQVQVSATHLGRTQVRAYAQPQDMEQVLTYLRLLDPYPQADIDPETFRSDTYEIVLYRSDGSTATYRQISQDFLQEENGPWYRIVPGTPLHFPETTTIING